MKKQITNGIAIKLTNVSKRYNIHHEKPTFVERVLKHSNEEFWALNHVNLKIRKGDSIGIIGPNGSGKTTLLKIISGITIPTGGNIEKHGRIVSLIELDAGFHPELTGEQNIFLNGLLLGMKKKEINIKLKDIIRFADIGRFIDSPLFTYSSGMKLRLGFSIAINTDPDVLILDEGIAVGDLEFIEKTTAKIKALLKKKLTLVISSHNLNLIRYLSRRVLIMEHGVISRDGTLNLLDKYQKGR